MALSASLASAAVPREVQCRSGTRPKSVVFHLCVFWFVWFSLYSLEDLGMRHTSWHSSRSRDVCATTVWETRGAANTEILHKDAGDPGHGV